jgi:hypothetical protein
LKVRVPIVKLCGVIGRYQEKSGKRQTVIPDPVCETGFHRLKGCQKVPMHHSRERDTKVMVDPMFLMLGPTKDMGARKETDPLTRSTTRRLPPEGRVNTNARMGSRVTEEVWMALGNL